MKSLSSVGIGLSIAFASLLLALVGELYYLLWWKKRLTSRRDFFYMFCLKTSSSSSPPTTNEDDVHHHNNLHSNKDGMLKPFDDHQHQHHHHQPELMRPTPRFLFTIAEETKEDLELEEGKSKGKFGSRDMSVETPFLTPLASPTFLTPPHTPTVDEPIQQQGFDPLFEATTDAEFNKLRSSPPPKFKFLQEAEEKLHKRMLMVDEDNDGNNNGGFDEENGEMTPPSRYLKDEEDESFITIIVNNNHSHQQVIPLSLTKKN
ncbi:uncharacterized protein LOC105781086 [Gossypium raimondii]|uniref:Uncharacterized protein n=2 Tax=Gossypium raimondii TaxID=29730 RepID=A0A0D2W219_GOSRA|nr:uncharacterized protein LOC105781086 [Gossypium raimondii]KJB78845.1 hypothetical protein B456_013G022600 [Gossypium raimondii]